MNEAWYLARAAGFAAYILLFLVVALGLAIHTRASDRLLARWRVNDLHEFGSLLALAFVALHAGVLLADTFVGYSPMQILVPFTAATRNFWTGIGVISGYLLAIVVASFYVRRWIGYRAWRLMHYSTFGLYVLATLHGIFTGTDSVTAWGQLLYMGTGGTVLALVIYRVVPTGKQRRGTTNQPVRGGHRRLGWGVAALGVAAVTLLAGGFGPFRWFGGAGDTVQTELVSAQANVASANNADLTQPATGADQGQSDAQSTDDTVANDAEDGPVTTNADGHEHHSDDHDQDSHDEGD